MTPPHPDLPDGTAPQHGNRFTCRIIVCSELLPSGVIVYGRPILIPLGSFHVAIVDWATGKSTPQKRGVVGAAVAVPPGIGIAKSEFWRRFAMDWPVSADTARCA